MKMFDAVLFLLGKEKKQVIFKLKKSRKNTENTFTSTQCIAVDYRRLCDAYIYYKTLCHSISFFIN